MDTTQTVIPSSVFLGHFLLAATGIIYSVYWTLDYYHGASGLVTLLLLPVLGAIVAGFAGICLFYSSSAALLQPDRLQNWSIIIAGIVLFVLSLILMSRVFHRPFTSEIFFTFLWAIAEMNVVYSLYVSGRITQAPFFMITAGILACLAVCLVCYRVHLDLEGYRRMVNGLIPYIVVTAFNILVLAGLFIVNGKS